MPQTEARELYNYSTRIYIYNNNYKGNFVTSKLISFIYVTLDYCSIYRFGYCFSFDNM